MPDNLQRVVSKVLADKLALIPQLVVTAPGVPTVTPQGSPGATSYSYKVVSVSRGGKVSAGSPAGSTSTGNATLNATNYNRITWTAVEGAEGGYLVYRTVGGATQGLIGRVAPGAGVQLDDTGLAGDGTLPLATGEARISIGEEDPDVPLDCTALVIIPTRFDYEAFLGGPEEIDYPAGNKVVMDFGCWSGRFELRVVSPDKATREEVQSAIHRVFIGSDPTKTRRGVMVGLTPALTLHSALGVVITTYQAPAAFSLLSDSWAEELVFDKKRWLSVAVDVSYPALIVWDDAYTIEEYHSALSEDLSVDAVVTDEISVDEEGNITLMSAVFNKTLGSLTLASSGTVV